MKHIVIIVTVALLLGSVGCGCFRNGGSLGKYLNKLAFVKCIENKLSVCGRFFVCFMLGKC